MYLSSGFPYKLFYACFVDSSLCLAIVLKNRMRDVILDSGRHGSYTRIYRYYDKFLRRRKKGDFIRPKKQISWKWTDRFPYTKTLLRPYRKIHTEIRASILDFCLKTSGHEYSFKHNDDEWRQLLTRRWNNTKLRK